MTFLPIVGRELRVASRRRGTYWIRAGAAAGVMILGIWLFLMMRREPAREVAMALFGILTGSAALYSLLSGVRSTADCISQEKRDGTLGLLFLTDLKGYDVVLGKLAATSLNAFYSVLAIVPMLAIPLLMGGVTLGEFGRMALVTVNTMFFSLAIGICVSAISRISRKAIAVTFFIILLLTAGPPLAGAWQAMFGSARNVQTLYMLPSVGFNYFMAWDASYRWHPEQFWYSLGVIHSLGWAFLTVAAITVPHTWQDKPRTVSVLRWRERWQMWSYGPIAERLSFRRRLLEQGAFFWLAARARLKPMYVWAVLGLLTCGWVWGLIKYPREWLHPAMYVVTGLLLNVVIKGWFASESGRQLAEDRLHGTIELLLSTPLTVRDIMRGQLLALFRQFLWPGLVVLSCFAIFMAAGLTSEDIGREERSLWILFWPAAAAMMLMDLAALFWVGTWQALVAKNPQRAASTSLARILVFPWVVLALLALMISLLAINSRSGGPGPEFFLTMWFVVGAVTDLAFGSQARRKVLTEFRLAAAQKYAPRPGFWKRVLHPAGVADGLPPRVIAVQK